MTFGVQVALIGMNYFNSHAHVERDPYNYYNVNTGADFNSHAHVERDLGQVVVITGKRGISTHTLTWSVTRSHGRKAGGTSISTHTLTWSVTQSTS